MKINWTIVVGVIGLVMTGGVGFAAWNAGVAYGNQNAQSIQREFFTNRFPQQAGGSGTQTTQAGQTDPAGQTAPGPRGGQAGQASQLGRLVAAGTVKSVQGNKIEVTTQNGNVVTVTIDQQTQIIKTVSGQAADIQPGMRVNVTSDQASAAASPVNARLITIQGAGTPQSQ